MDKKFSEMFSFRKTGNKSIEVIADTEDALAAFMYYVVVISFQYVDELFPDGDITKILAKIDEDMDGTEDIEENKDYHLYFDNENLNESEEDW